METFSEDKPSASSPLVTPRCLSSSSMPRRRRLSTCVPPESLSNSVSDNLGGSQSGPKSSLLLSETNVSTDTTVLDDLTRKICWTKKSTVKRLSADRCFPGAAACGKVEEAEIQHYVPADVVESDVKSKEIEEVVTSGIGSIGVQSKVHSEKAPLQKSASRVVKASDTQGVHTNEVFKVNAACSSGVGAYPEASSGVTQPQFKTGLRHSRLQKVRTLVKHLYFLLPALSSIAMLHSLWYPLLPICIRSYTDQLIPSRIIFTSQNPPLHAFHTSVQSPFDTTSTNGKHSRNQQYDHGNLDKIVQAANPAASGTSSLSWYSAEALKGEFPQYAAHSVPTPAALIAHSNEFKKEIIRVVEDVYVAVGYGLANCVIVNATEGLVIIDAMESTATMSAVWDAWRQLPYSDKPVKALIYTHFHTDHVFGAAAVVQPNVTEIHAYWLTDAEMSKVFTLTAGSTYRRSMRQFGVFIDSPDFVNAGIGPTLHYSSNEEIGTVLPTHIMREERKTLHIAGVSIELIHAPGESKDQLVVWLKEKKLLVGADNLYKSFPNIYAIRGTETRDCNDWIASLDLMRSLEPEHLVLGHTRPLAGKDYINATLMAYRDAIQFIHDQTVRFMNKGYYANDIAHIIKLPPHLASHPFLQPFYGTVPWAVKAIFTQYVGWYSGNPEDLAVVSTREKAELLLSLAGSLQNLLAHALKNLREDRVQQALELASAAHIIAPQSEEAKTLRILALRACAAKQEAATGRNWLLTAALELEGRANLKLSDSQKRETLSKLSMQQMFELLPVRLVAEKALDFSCILEFKFTDVNERLCVHYRKGIAYQRWPCESDPDAIVQSSRNVWLGIVNNERSLPFAVLKGDVKLSGSIFTLLKALQYVELDAD